MQDLVGKRVMDKKTKARGRIVSINGNSMKVAFYDDVVTYLYPAAFADQLLLEDEELQEDVQKAGYDSSFSLFKVKYAAAVNAEIAYLRRTGGKHYRIVDGELISVRQNRYVYSFDTDTELHFPDGTLIHLHFLDNIIPASVISCEDFSIVFQTMEFLGETVDSIEFTAEAWRLIEALLERINEFDAENSPIAYEVACRGISQIDKRGYIAMGQSEARKKASSDAITFIWGPPGTGKTTTLSWITQDALQKKERILMISYSNVSVDGALLKVAGMSEHPEGKIIRYGYPRMDEVLESKTLTSYAYVMQKNPQLADEYSRLVEEKKKLRKKDPRRLDINRRIANIRSSLAHKEIELVNNAAFVATTVSKAIVDSAIYKQKFDVVIFDEASMAYVPQIVFAAGLARKRFCCLGDFRQLPAIVQNPDDTFLSRDIFEHTGITSAVDNGYGHNWLVMLNTQYRMHPRIAEFVSKNMYNYLLQSAYSIYQLRQQIADLSPLKNEPMGLIDLSKSYSVCIKTMDGSRINLLSALVSVLLAERFGGQYGVGIITPYSAQSRLILAMIRDLQENDSKFSNISCATVHQFQGSEKPIIIYDAVDCFRMPYPGTLLTSKKNDTANRLFNVALTRTQGKFLMVANTDYMFMKNISKQLMFTKMLNEMRNRKEFISGDDLFEQIGTDVDENPHVFMGERDEVDSWNRFIEDIDMSQDSIFIDVPGVIDDDPDALEEFGSSIMKAAERGVRIYIRVAENISIPRILEPFKHIHSFVTTPLTIIDKNTIWFGEPLCAADFFSEGNVIETKCFPCLRYIGKYTARNLKALLEIPGF